MVLNVFINLREKSHQTDWYIFSNNIFYWLPACKGGAFIIWRSQCRLFPHTQLPATFISICIGELQSLVESNGRVQREGIWPRKKFNLTSLVRSVNCYFTLKVAIFIFLSFCYALGNLRDAWCSLHCHIYIFIHTSVHGRGDSLVIL